MANHQARVKSLRIEEVPASDVPIDLLLVADPSEEAIRKYLNKSRCFLAYFDKKIVGVGIVKPAQSKVWELMNIGVLPSDQKKGVGTRLIRHIIDKSKRSGASALEVGTGTFGYPLTFYQRHGFRVDRLDKNFFLKNYPNPVLENGVQHKDMLRLKLDFSINENKS